MFQQVDPMGIYVCAVSGLESAFSSPFWLFFWWGFLTSHISSAQGSTQSLKVGNVWVPWACSCLCRTRARHAGNPGYVGTCQGPSQLPVLLQFCVKAAAILPVYCWTRWWAIACSKMPSATCSSCFLVSWTDNVPNPVRPSGNGSGASYHPSLRWPGWTLGGVEGEDGGSSGRGHGRFLLLLQEL